MDKDVKWVGSSLDDQRDLPPEVRRELGFDLRRVQQGKLPRDWKALKAVGPGVMEIRIRLDGAFRMRYVAKFAEAVYVLHVFLKKTQRTSELDLAVAAPSVFGLCAAIAPPAQTATVVSNQANARAAVVSIKFFVMGGVYDSMIDGARRLHTTLDEYSAPVTYLEVSEGHNTNTFRAHLDDALRALIPPS